MISMRMMDLSNRIALFLFSQGITTKSSLLIKIAKNIVNKAHFVHHLLSQRRFVKIKKCFENLPKIIILSRNLVFFVQILSVLNIISTRAIVRIEIVVLLCFKMIETFKINDFSRTIRFVLILLDNPLLLHRDTII